MPGDGSATMHHVHADDVAQVFERALDVPEASVGESFHAVSPRALTVRGFAEEAYGWWGHEPRLRSVPWPEFEEAGGRRARRDELGAPAPQPGLLDREAGRPARLRAGLDSSQDTAREAVAWLAAHDADHDLPALVTR